MSILFFSLLAADRAVRRLRRGLLPAVRATCAARRARRRLAVRRVRTRPPGAGARGAHRRRRGALCGARGGQAAGAAQAQVASRRRGRQPGQSVRPGGGRGGRRRKERAWQPTSRLAPRQRQRGRGEAPSTQYVRHRRGHCGAALVSTAHQGQLHVIHVFFYLLSSCYFVS